MLTNSVGQEFKYGKEDFVVSAPRWIQPHLGRLED